jgi:hypothetical protein
MASSYYDKLLKFISEANGTGISDTGYFPTVTANREPRVSRRQQKINAARDAQKAKLQGISAASNDLPHGEVANRVHAARVEKDKQVPVEIATDAARLKASGIKPGTQGDQLLRQGVTPGPAGVAPKLDAEPPTVAKVHAKERETTPTAPHRPGMYSVVGGRGIPGHGTRIQTPGSVKAERGALPPNAKPGDRPPLAVGFASAPSEKPNTGFGSRPGMRTVTRKVQRARGWAQADNVTVNTDDPAPRLPTPSGTTNIDGVMMAVPHTSTPSVTRTVSPAKARRANRREQARQTGRPTASSLPNWRVSTAVTKSGRPSSGPSRRGPENSSTVNFSISLGKYLTEHRYD